MNSDWLIDFLVKIDFKDNDNRASGIIVKLDNFKDNFFVFTAKHTFEDENKKLIINKDEFSVLYQNKQKIEFEEYIILEEDIIVFIFDNAILKEIENFDCTMMSSKINNFGKCIFRGYPRSQLDGGSLSEPSSYIQEKENNENLYQIRPDRKNTDTIDSSGLSHAKGFSGSGLFIEEKGQYALVGIIKEHEKNLSAYNYIALAPLIDEIIEKLSFKCDGGNSFKNPPIKIPIIKDEVEIGIITMRTVPVKMDDGKILNVSIYPVTFEEYDLFYEDKKDTLKLKKPINTHFFKDRRGIYPVINVSWYDANKYCLWLSEELEKNIRLPTIKEWDEIAKQNNDYFEIKDKNFISRVGSYKAGKLGIYDMYRNIYQWCSDIVNNKYRAIKGSSFDDTLKEELTTRNLPEYPLKELGFRIVLEKDGTLKK